MARRVVDWLARTTWGLLLVLVLLCGGLTAAWFLSPRLLYVEHGVVPADVIIVLGGDAEGRVWRGLELYKEDVAPHPVVGCGRWRITASAAGAGGSGFACDCRKTGSELTIDV
jgi:hypothetical protein